jgi:hypothetical protein
MQDLVKTCYALTNGQTLGEPAAPGEAHARRLRPRVQALDIWAWKK